GNLRQVSFTEGRRTHQFAAYAQRERSAGKELRSIGCVHSSGGNEVCVGEGALERLEIFRSAYVAAGKDLDEPGPGILSCHQLGWGERARDGELAAGKRNGNYGKRQTGTDQKFRAHRQT